MNKKNTILVVDDINENRMMLAQILTDNTDYAVNLANDGTSVIETIDRKPPDLILLDIMMPGMDGFEVAKILKKRETTRDIPIIFITALTEMNQIVQGFEAGGVDYITKPFNKTELLARVNAHISIKQMQDELKEKNALLADRELHLLDLVEQKTKKLERITLAMVNALENANYFNDEDTGNHIRRVCEYSRFIAEHHGCNREFVKRIKTYSPLHDVGKVGISDYLLKKKRAYTPEEAEAMQQHVLIGARILGDGIIDRMAHNIALFHHERWDGTGYVQQKKGEEIPLEARIVTLVDVYDALGSRRSYKEPFPEEKIDTIMKESRGSHFDPDLVETLFNHKDGIIDIKHGLQEG